MLCARVAHSRALARYCSAGIWLSLTQPIKHELRERGVLGKIQTISAQDEIVLGIITAAVHEIELSKKGQQYSSSNRGLT
jgi:hypothetical protein